MEAEWSSQRSATALAPSPNSRRGPLSFARRHPLVWYFVLAYAGSWLVEGVYGALQPRHVLPGWWLDLLTFLGPTAAAFTMTAVVSGRAGMLALLRRYVQGRSSVIWYLLALVGIPALAFLGYLALPGAPSDLRLPSVGFILTYINVYGWTFALGGPLGEEPGWRGFALPRLQQTHGPLVGSLILGVLWAFWHLPLFFVLPHYNGAGNNLMEIVRAFVVFVLFVAGVTVLFTWIFNRTGGGLLFVMLAHASMNTAFNLFPAFFPGLSALSWVSSASVISFALVVLATALVVAELTKGRLGERSNPDVGK